MAVITVGSHVVAWVVFGLACGSLALFVIGMGCFITLRSAKCRAAATSRTLVSSTSSPDSYHSPPPPSDTKCATPPPTSSAPLSATIVPFPPPPPYSEALSADTSKQFEQTVQSDEMCRSSMFPRASRVSLSLSRSSLSAMHSLSAATQPPPSSLSQSDEESDAVEQPPLFPAPLPSLPPLTLTPAGASQLPMGPSLCAGSIGVMWSADCVPHVFNADFGSDALVNVQPHSGILTKPRIRELACHDSILMILA